MNNARNTPMSMPGHPTLLGLIVLLMALPVLATGETVYRCESPEGVEFSDQSCGPDPQTITIEDNRIGGSLGDHLPDFEDYPETSPSDDEQPLEQDSTCRFIKSTDLRTYIAREQVVPGMTRDHVERAFGRTSEIYGEPQETWVYQTKYYGALYELTYVYFRNGCVESVIYRKP